MEALIAFAESNIGITPEPSDGNPQIERGAGGSAELPPQSDVEASAFACLERKAYDHRVPEHADRYVLHPLLDYRIKEKG